MVEKLTVLAEKMPEIIVKVQGTGLLCSAELNPETHQVVGFGQVEELCRTMGLGIIHGGKNALRFTPHFAITSEEIDLIIEIIEQALVLHANDDS